jgi:hypothetical protein
MMGKRLWFGLGVLLLLAGAAWAGYAPGGLLNGGTHWPSHVPFDSYREIPPEEPSFLPILGWILFAVGFLLFVLALARGLRIAAVVLFAAAGLVLTLYWGWYTRPVPEEPASDTFFKLCKAYLELADNLKLRAAEEKCSDAEDPRQQPAHKELRITYVTKTAWNFEQADTFLRALRGEWAITAEEAESRVKPMSRAVQDGHLIGIRFLYLVDNHRGQAQAWFEAKENGNSRMHAVVEETTRGAWGMPFWVPASAMFGVLVTAALWCAAGMILCVRYFLRGRKAPDTV